MGILAGKKEITNDLRAVEKNFERDSWQIPKKISDSWIFSIHVVDAIDSGDMLRAVNWHPAQTSEGGEGVKYWVVDTITDNPQVTYPGFLEAGTKYMTARSPAKKGIEREDFVSTITDMTESGFSHAKS